MEWEEEDWRYSTPGSSDIHQRDESKLQRCTHQINQLDEKEGFWYEMESFKKLWYAEHWSLFLEGACRIPKYLLGSSVSNICLGVDNFEPVFTQLHASAFFFTS